MSATLNVENAKTFILAGNATFTVKSLVTGKHYTFKVQEAENSQGRFFVKVLTGRDNENDYSYMGMIDRGTFRTTKASKIGPEAPQYKAFVFTYDNLYGRGRIDDRMEIYHEDRCGRCGRKLTTPESVKRSFGDECAQILGLI